MKKITLFLAGAFMSTFLNAQNINFSDANFKSALLAHGVGITGTNISVIDANGDGEISISEAQAYTGRIDVGSKNISDLTGIEAFTNLTHLYCHKNQLTSLDISKNVALEYLNCYKNQLTILDVSKNVTLEYLNCSENKLTNLDLSKNTTLNHIRCASNSLTSLNTNNNPALVEIECSDNSITSLNVSANSSLNRFFCNKNKLTNIDVTNQLNLQTLSSADNVITSIDVSNNTKLLSLFVNNNKLMSIDVSKNNLLNNLNVNNNELKSLDVSMNQNLLTFFCKDNQLTNLNIANGNNTRLSFLELRGNSALNCIQHDTGFNPANQPILFDFSTGAIIAGWFKDSTASWSDNCTPAGVNDVTFSSVVTLYPNPVSSNLYVSTNNTQISAVEIYNILGKKVTSTLEKQVEVSNLPSGVYVLKVLSSEGKVATKKFIKQ